MKLHAVVILLAVALGSALFGVVGAFLAVPVVAVVAEMLRYVSETIETESAQAYDGEPDDADDGEPDESVASAGGDTESSGS